MQGPLLRVLVVTLGLILYPREEPCVEEWVDIVTEGIEEHDRLLSEARKPYTEMPFNDQAPQTDSKAQALMNFEVTLVKPREPTASSNAPDTFLTPEHLPRIYWEGEAENEYVESKDSVKSHFVAEPDANPPQETLADYREEPATPRHEEHIKLDRVPSHRVANENIQTSWALTDAQRSTQGERQRAAVPPRPSKPMQRVMGREAEDYLWYIWTIFSALSLVHFLSKYLNCYSLKEFVEVWLQSNTPPLEHVSGRAPLPDSNTLHLFHARFVKVSHAKMWRTRAFLEGFIFDLLKVMRTTSGDSAGVVIEDFIQTESGCGIVVPFVPPEPYRFQCRLWSTSDDCKQGCGKINIVEKIESQNGCHCESSDTHDMVCMLHRQVEKLTGKHRTDVYSLLCMKNTTFLSKAKVTKWFKGTVRKAWEQISHKYEFELSFSKADITGALVVQFRSGRKIHFTLNPVVKLDNTMAYLLTTPCSTNISDISWSMSLAKYEEHFLTQVCKTLPEDTCHNQVLEILAFLHQKQTALTGSSALKDFHLKNALIELLLSTDPSQWHPEDIHSRLRDLVMLMEKRLRQRLLRHALTGKALAHNIELPTELLQTHSVNLFHPLVAKDCTYTKTLEHFQELLRNASLLIEDYTSESERCDSE